MAIVNKDSAEIFKAYNHYNNIHGDIKALKQAALALTFVNYQEDKLVNFVKVENNKFPNESRLKIDSLISEISSPKANPQENKNQIVSTYQKTIKNDADNFETIQKLGYHYSKNGEYDKAILYLKKYLKNPDRKDGGKTEFTIALCYAAKRDNINACKYLQIAKEKKYPRAEEISSKLCI